MQPRTEYDPPARLFDVGLNFNPRPLEDHLHNVGREMLRFAKSISQLSDDVKVMKGQLASLQNRVGDNDDRLTKITLGHEQQLRVLQQQTSQALPISQYNAMSASVNEQLKALELQVAKIEGPGGKRAMEHLESTVSQWVNTWAKTQLSKDLEVLEGRVREFTRVHVEQRVDGIKAQTDSTLVGIRKELSTCATHDQFRVLSEQVRDRVGHEVKTFDDRVSAQESLNDRSRRDTAEKIRAMEQRIAFLNAQMAPLVAHDPAAPSPVATVAAQQGIALSPSRVAPRTVSPEQPEGSPTTDAPEATASMTAAGAAAAPPPVPSVSGGDSSPTAAGGEAAVRTVAGMRTVDVEGGLESGGDAAQARYILSSPAFSLFRQQLIEDMRMRLGSAKNEHASESELQMFDIRHDIRSRTTPERVVELIRQHADVQTPALVAALEQRVAALDKDKVSQFDFREGLREKGDQHVVDQKADKIALHDFATETRQRVDELNRALQQHQSEREEFRLILRDVVHSHKRATALGEGAPPGAPAGAHAVGGGANGAPRVPGGPMMRTGAESSLSLPAISGGSRGGGRHGATTASSAAGGDTGTASNIDGGVVGSAVDPRPPSISTPHRPTDGRPRGGASTPRGKAGSGRASASPSAVGGGAPLQARGTPTDKVRQPHAATARAQPHATASGVEGPETPAQAAYRATIGSSLGQQVPVGQQFASQLHQPGDREKLAIKSALESESAGRREATPPGMPE